MAQLNSWRRCTRCQPPAYPVGLGRRQHEAFLAGVDVCVAAQQASAVAKGDAPKSFGLCVCVCDANRKYTKEVYPHNIMSQYACMVYMK